MSELPSAASQDRTRASHQPAPDWRRVYLTGFMGCGKSTIGQRLARRLGWDFIDLDQAVEARAGQSIASIFAIDGEEAFRAMEAEALAATTTQERLVIGTGGGALVQPGAMDCAKAAGYVVYLRVPFDVLLRRLQRNTRRPLLYGPDGTLLPPEALAARVQGLLDARTPTYEQAHFIVDVDDRPADETVETVLRALR